MNADTSLFWKLFNWQTVSNQRRRTKQTLCTLLFRNLSLLLSFGNQFKFVAMGKHKAVIIRKSGHCSCPKQTETHTLVCSYSIQCSTSCELASMTLYSCPTHARNTRYSSANMEETHVIYLHIC